jgi:hypothetical protein
MRSKSLLFGLSTFVIVLLLLSNVSAGTWQDDYSNGLVSYAKLSEGTGTVAYNLMNNAKYNWTIFNGQWNLTNFKFDSSYQFTGGNTYLQSVSPSNNQLANQTNLSYTMWLYPLDASNCFASAYEGIFSISTTQMELSYSDSACELSLYTGTGGRLNSGKLIKPNMWNFVAVTHTGGTSKIYINGTLANSGTGKSWTDDSTGVFRWGRGGSGYYTGGMDELAIWNKTLSATEILNMYNAGVGMQPNIGVSTLIATSSYPSTDSIINATSISFGCNFSSTYQNISSVVLNITNKTSGVQVYSNTISASADTLSLNQSWSVTTLTNDIYNWTCKGYGDKGINATSTIRNFSLIYTVPYASLYIPVNNSYTNNTAVSFYANTSSLGWTANISNVSLTIYNQSMYLINQTNYTGVNDNFWIGIVNLLQGSYMWVVTLVNDFADTATSGLYNLFVDTSAPNITISSPINGYYYNTTTIDLVYTIGDNFNLSTNYTTGTPFVEGINTFTVYANDTAGNLISNSTTFTVDTIAPTVVINTPTATNYSTTYINFNTTVSDTNLQTCMYSLNGATNITYTCNINLSLLGVQGTNTIYSFVNDSAGNMNSTTVSFNIDTVNPLVNILYPTSLLTYAYIGQNISFNYSISDNNLQSCWFNYNGTNLSTSCVNNNSLILSYAKSIILYANDSYGNLNSSNLTWDYNIFETNQSYNIITTEGNIETFTINVTTNLQISTADLIYNNTLYSGTLTNYGSNNYINNINITIPSISIQGNKSFYWQITLSDGTMSNSTSHNQTIQTLDIDNCTSYPKLIMNLSLKDEDLRTLLDDSYSNSTIEVQILVYPLNSNNTIIEYNASFTSKNNVRLCMPDVLNSSNYNLNGVIRYTADNYVSEFYHLQNQPLNNATIPFNINLYDLLSSRSQEFLVTYKDSNFIPQSNVLVNVNRKYIPQGNFETVEVAKTDTAGQTLIHLVLSEVIYTLTITRDGKILAILDSVLAKCENVATGVCTIPINELATTIPLNLFKQAGGISYSQSFNETTKTITTIFVSTEGIKTVSINATKFDRFGNTSVCSNSLTSTSGTLTCVIPDSFGNSTVIIDLYSNGEAIGSTSYSLRLKASEISGSEGIILAIIVVITLSMLFISSPIAVLFGAGLGLIFSTSLFLFEGGSLFGKTIGIMIYFIICCTIIVWKFNKGEQS